MSRAAGSSGRPFVTRVPHVPRLSRAGLFLLLLIAVAFVVALTFLWRPRTPPERGELEAEPAFALVMPGADELGRVGGDRELTFEGEQLAFAGHIYGTLATSAEVYLFYERELARLGWRPEPPPFPRSSVELENREYCKSGIVFRLAIEDKDRAFQRAFYRGRTYVTVFDARLDAVDPRVACPIPPFRSPGP